MSRRRGNTSVAASPVLIGAATVLVALVAVFIAYNANSGLPFVPTYNLNAELPSGGKLVKGNEVRVGGFRVGVVKDIKPEVTTVNGERRSVAVAELALDKKIEPLARDTKFRSDRARPRAEVHRARAGDEKATWQSGDTVPVTQSSEPLEFEDLFSTFDHKTRPNIQNATDGFGNAFAGRGQAINSSIQALNPFFKALTPVMQNLSDPSTELDQFFLQIGRSAQVARWRARRRCCSPTWRTRSRPSPPTRARSRTRSRRARRRWTSRSTRSGCSARSWRTSPTSRRGCARGQELPRSLPAINRAFAVGTPVLPRTVELNENLEKAFGEAEDLFQNPNTLLALKDLTTAVTVTRPALQFIAPYQTVCNYLNYFIHPLGEMQSVVQTGPTGGGTLLNQNVKIPNSHQQNNYGSSTAARPWDILENQKPQGAKDHQGNPLFRLYAPAYSPAIDAQGNADCQLGQNGYPNGALGPAATSAATSRTTPRSTACRSRTRSARAQTARSPRTTSRPLRRHVQVARARHRQPGGRAMSALEWHEPVPRRRPGAGPRRAVHLLRLHEGEPVREPVRVQGRLQRREQPEAEVAGPDRRRGGGQGPEGRARDRRQGRRPGDDGGRGQGPRSRRTRS